MQITDNAKEQQLMPLFRLGFRPFFLFASCFAILGIGAWILSLSSIISFSPYGGILWWHSHEMLFGFSFAVIIGFLLTAIQTWTGTPGLRGWPLFILFTVWLLARVMMLWEAAPWALLLVVDLSTPVLAGYFLWRSVYQARQWRNLFFVPVMLLFALTNLAMHFSLIDNTPPLGSQPAHTVVLLITLVMCIMGGRVIPFFTARGTGTERTSAISIIEFLSLAPLWLLVALSLFQPLIVIDKSWIALLAIVASIANLLRIIRWRPWLTFRVPLLWSLHGAYIFIVGGLFAYAVSTVKPLQLPPSLALHFLTVGAIGALILSMMTRVSLGHTGRPLQIKPPMVTAFAFILLAGICRTLLPILTPSLSLLAYQLSGLLWVLAYGIFVVKYWPILTKPRLDGRPG